MGKTRSALAWLLAFLVSDNLRASEINEGEGGRLVLYSKGHEVIYKNILGSNEGMDRDLISINGSAALRVSARFEFYYTLIVKDVGVLIDCAYADARNNYNGARVSAGICGLNIKLGKGYDEVAQSHLNTWTDRLFSFDTKSVFKDHRATSFLLGYVGGVEVYDRYSSVAELDGASPQKYIKSAAGCFNFGSKTGFPIFTNDVDFKINYLDILISSTPMRFQRLTEQDLMRIAVNKCD